MGVALSGEPGVGGVFSSSSEITSTSSESLTMNTERLREVDKNDEFVMIPH